MSSSDSWSTTIISIILGLLLLLFVYLWFESREEDSEGNKVFNPQKLGIILRNLFGYCFPDAILTFFASLCICCGYVGNSCLDQINADEERRETKRMARLAANLTKKSKSKKKKVKSMKSDHDFSALSSSEDELDLELGSVTSSGSSSRRKEKNRIMKLNQKSPMTSAPQRETSAHGIDQSGDRSLRGTGMVSSSIQDTNISQQQQRQQQPHRPHIASPMGLECHEDEQEEASDLSSDHSSLSSHSESSAEQVLIELSSHHSPLRNLPSSSSSPPSSPHDLSRPPPLPSSRRNVHSNSLLANHFIAKEFLEQHIAIEDQLLAQQTSFSLLSLTDLPTPPPRSDYSNTHSY
jgi:hypothetical protein